MILRRTTARSGITLTEILIAIMIMGVGMVSVATLFPIGLLRIREATRDARSTILAQSAANDAAIRGVPNAKGLANPDSFVDRRVPWYAEWRGLNATFPNYPFTITPFTHDIATTRQGGSRFSEGVYSEYFAPGLPVAYDPLFWATTHYNTEGTGAVHSPLTLSPPSAVATEGSEGRFGSGIGFIRQAGSELPPAHGLQRLTNFAPYDALVPWPYSYSTPSIEQFLQANKPELLSFADVVGKVFSSLDDPVLTDDETGRSGSPVVPANFASGVDANGNPLYASERTYEFTWMLTGRLGVAGDPSVFEGQIVVFHRRPIGLDPVEVAETYGGDVPGPVLVPTGERVVEAIWGYTNNLQGLERIEAPRILDGYYSIADARTVLLRWPRSMPDPLVRVGDYIADVTYERYRETDPAILNAYPPGAMITRNYLPDNQLTGAHGARYPGQRIHWYRIVQRGEIERDPVLVNHNRVIVRVDTPLQAKTRLVVVDGEVEAAVPEAALINPYVVRVFPITLFSR